MEPIKTVCYYCTEPTKRKAGRTSNFHIDVGFLWECDNENCTNPEKERQKLMQKVFNTFQQNTSLNRENIENGVDIQNLIKLKKASKIGSNAIIKALSIIKNNMKHGCTKSKLYQ
jgi:hypothetical protein